MASPERTGLIPTVVGARRSLLLSSAQRRGLALVPLGISVGVASALGLAPFGLAGALGGMLSCSVGRRLAKGGGGGASEFGWFVVVSWSALAGVVRFGTLDLSSALAAQGVLAPGPLTGPPAAAAASLLGSAAGLAAASMWVASRLPLGNGASPAESLLVWGEIALAGAVVASSSWGPGLGALVYGPLDLGTVWRVSISLAAAAAFVAAISVSRGFLSRRNTDWVPWAVAPAALVALAVAVWAG